ncbi:hypothetical protein BDF22DRAFT_691574 [Syncephalis plumigaleata]|nr:hypothetical protein BDF22DRAFT_691574 [Syncephalis plumigaleata]
MKFSSAIAIVAVVALATLATTGEANPILDRRADEPARPNSNDRNNLSAACRSAIKQLNKAVHDLKIAKVEHSHATQRNKNAAHQKERKAEQDLLTKADDVHDKCL